MSKYPAAPLLAVLVLVSLPAPARAQVAPAPDTWVGGYAQFYTGIGGFFDPGTASEWVFSDNSFGLGATVQRTFGQGLLLGLDLGYARPEYERRDTALVVGGGVVTRGEANVVTAMATGRFASGGGGDLGFYLSGGAGTIMYNLSDVGGWNADLALRAATGLEYRMSRSQMVYLEWGRIWGYHEKDGVSGGKATHSNLKLGVRFGS